MNRVILGIVVYAVSSISALAQWTLPEIKVSDINVGDTVYLFNKEAVGFMRGHSLLFLCRLLLKTWKKVPSAATSTIFRG